MTTLLYTLQIGCSSCNNKVDMETDLKITIETYWSAQQQGNWELCYEHFSDEALADLRSKNNKLFKNLESYMTERSKLPKVKSFKILKNTVSASQNEAFVETGVRYHEKTKPLIVKQHWKKTVKATWKLAP